MTIDEAITHAREVAERNRRAINFESLDNIDDDIKINCSNCAEEHEQLAEWLEELKTYREIGTVVECRAAVEIIRYMIQEGIEPEVLEAYVRFEDELVKKGFTVKSVLEAREKQIAAKPLGGKDIEGNEYAICRECSAILSDGEWFAQYCPDCGKKVDWREEEYGGLCNRF